MIQSLFLVAYDEMETPVVGSNVIRTLLTRRQDESFFTNILKSFAECSTIKPDTLINLLQKSLDNQVVIQSRNNHFVDKIAKVPCKGKVGVLDSRLPMLVLAEEVNNIKGLRMEETLVTVQ